LSAIYFAVHSIYPDVTSLHLVDSPFIELLKTGKLSLDSLEVIKNKIG